jgi:hypothetical protein
MADNWLRFVGLAFATVLLIYLIVRCVRVSIGGAFHFGLGTRVHRDDNPKDFAFLAWAQIIGTLIFFGVYCYVVYEKFLVGLGWIEQ